MNTFDREGAPPPSPWRAAGRLFRLLRKELSEVLRDRRTIITLLFMPLLLYPLLSIAFRQVSAANLLDLASTDKGKKSAAAKEAVPQIRIGVSNEDDYETMRRLLGRGDRFFREVEAAKGRKANLIQAWEIVIVPDLEKALEQGAIDVGARVEGQLPVRRAVVKGLAPEAYRNREVVVQLLSLVDSGSSLKAREEVELRLLWFHQTMVAWRMDVQNENFPIALVHLENVSLTRPGGGAVISLPALIPLILILMTITGAVYPAIDATAGERERGTLEMLVAAPVPRLGLLVAKYGAVVAVAVLTGLVNLVGMVVTLKFSGLETEVVKGGLSLAVLSQIVALLLLFALFFAALLLCITSFARSFKEAQAYLIPLMLVSLGPGIIGILPGVKLEGLFVVAPLVNIVLLARDLFEGQADAVGALLVVFVTLIYAGAAITLAARVFGAESVLYSEQSGWSDLFRRPEEPQEVAGVAAAFWCLALMVPIQYVVQGAFAFLGPATPTDFLVLMLVMNVLNLFLFLGLPILAAWLGRVRAITGFALARPSLFSLAVALLLGAGLWPGVLWVLEQAYGRYHEAAEQLLGGATAGTSFTGLMIVTVVLAGVVEELFFRVLPLN